MHAEWISIQNSLLNIRNLLLKKKLINSVYFYLKKIKKTKEFITTIIL